jgi:hypothetical protein
MKKIWRMTTMDLEEWKYLRSWVINSSQNVLAQSSGLDLQEQAIVLVAAQESEVDVEVMTQMEVEVEMMNQNNISK